MSQQVAKRYAQALYASALSKKQVEKADADAAVVWEALESSAELRSFFNSPVIRAQKKAAVVQKLFTHKIDKGVLDFLLLLVEKGRENLLPEVLKAYGALRDEQLGIVVAEAKVAFKLGKAEEAQLQKSLEKLTGKEVRLHMKLDPNVIGGAVVKIGDKVYDGSIKSKLDALRKQLLKN